MSEVQPIVSSNLEGASYDAESRELTVHFTNGTAYRYKRVMPGMWKMFQSTFDGKKGSAGKFFHAHIRGLESEKI